MHACCRTGITPSCSSSYLTLSAQYWHAMRLIQKHPLDRGTPAQHQPQNSAAQHAAASVRGAASAHGFTGQDNSLQGNKNSSSSADMSGDCTHGKHVNCFPETTTVQTAVRMSPAGHAPCQLHLCLLDLPARCCRQSRHQHCTSPVKTMIPCKLLSLGRHYTSHTRPLGVDGLRSPAPSTVTV